jgi:hypothetical protein
MMLFKKKKAKREDLRLEEEHTDMGVRLGRVSAGRKRIYKREEDVRQKDALETAEPKPKIRVIELEFQIRPDEYEFVPLGRLERGANLSIEAEEIYGLNFSMYVMDKDNLRSYQKNGSTKGAIYRSPNSPDCKDSLDINRVAEYLLVLTSRALQIDRRIWLRVEIKSL